MPSEIMTECSKHLGLMMLHFSEDRQGSGTLKQPSAVEILSILTFVVVVVVVGGCDWTHFATKLL